MESLYRNRHFTDVMILDKDLNVLGEHLFNEFQVHASSNVFVGEEGVYRFATKKRGAFGAITCRS